MYCLPSSVRHSVGLVVQYTFRIIPLEPCRGSLLGRNCLCVCPFLSICLSISACLFSFFLLFVHRLVMMTTIMMAMMMGMMKYLAHAQLCTFSYSSFSVSQSVSQPATSSTSKSSSRSFLSCTHPIQASTSTHIM